MAVFAVSTATSYAATPVAPRWRTMHLVTTAYCHSGITKSGARTRPGIVAADPRVLPIGSVVRIDEPKEYAGDYMVLDTGAAIKGARLDIFMPSCSHAWRFGKRVVRAFTIRPARRR
jgi:3D (Asp-Asp-Asp) domain-containing protein